MEHVGDLERQGAADHALRAQLAEHRARGLAFVHGDDDLRPGPPRACDSASYQRTAASTMTTIAPAMPKTMRRRLRTWAEPRPDARRGSSASSPSNPRRRHRRGQRPPSRVGPVLTPGRRGCLRAASPPRGPPAATAIPPRRARREGPLGPVGPLMRCPTKPAAAPWPPRCRPPCGPPCRYGPPPAWSARPRRS